MKPRLAVAGSVGLLSLSLLGSLVLMSAAIQNSGRFGTLFSILLITNLLGLIAFGVLIGINTRDLVTQLRKRVPGARLTLRMLVIFVALSVLPACTLFGFSMNFLMRGVDSWFDVRIDKALGDALELSRNALDVRMREVMNQTGKLAEEIVAGRTATAVLDLGALRNPENAIVTETGDPDGGDLDLLRQRSGAEELLVVNLQGQLLQASIGGTDLVPNLPSAAVLLQVKQGRSYIALEPVGDRGLMIRAAVPLGPSLEGSGRVLQTIFPVAAGFNDLAQSVEGAHAKYNELEYLRRKLKLSFAMTLTLVLMSTLATATWAAFYSARRLTSPLTTLAEGTAAVAAGDYTMTLPVATSDDIGFLVSSFNQMTRRIGEARSELDSSNRYVSALLGQLSSGVLALDASRAITTLNDAGKRILELGDLPAVGLGLNSLAREREPLAPFSDCLLQGLSEGDEWQRECQIYTRGGRKVLMCRGSKLPLEDAAEVGYVVVFDDITALIRGQRDAAWSEVARRLAHEIKNPLTPIQLAAERLRHKYLAKMPPGDAETLDRLTTTIIQQVETMKAMVNTFSDYARAPAISQERTDLNQLVSGVVDLYRSANPEAHIEVEFEGGLPALSVDGTRLRQVFNNLIKNALEASPGRVAEVRVSTRLAADDGGGEHVEVTISDRGDGIPADMLGNIFEPYVTSKAKGTGLGLAIVKKIVEEHGGKVILANNDDSGATACIRLPLATNANQAVEPRKEALA